MKSNEILLVLALSAAGMANIVAWKAYQGVRDLRDDADQADKITMTHITEPMQALRGEYKKGTVYYSDVIVHTRDSVLPWDRTDYYLEKQRQLDSEFAEECIRACGGTDSNTGERFRCWCNGGANP